MYVNGKITIWKMKNFYCNVQISIRYSNFPLLLWTQTLNKHYLEAVVGCLFSLEFGCVNNWALTGVHICISCIFHRRMHVSRASATLGGQLHIHTMCLSMITSPQVWETPLPYTDIPCFDRVLFLHLVIDYDTITVTKCTCITVWW